MDIDLIDLLNQYVPYFDKISWYFEEFLRLLIKDNSSFTSFLLQLFILTTIFVIVYYIWFRRRFYYLISKIHIFSFVSILKIFYIWITDDAKGMQKIIEVYEETLNDGKPLQMVWIEPFLVVFVRNPEDVKIILSNRTCMEKPSLIYNIILHFLGLNLFTKPVSSWKPLRQKLSHIFTKNSCQNAIFNFNTSTNNWLRLLKLKQDWNCSDLNCMSQAVVMDCMLKFLTQSNITSYKEYIVFIEEMNRASKIAENRVHRFLFMSEILFNFTEDCKKLRTITHNNFSYFLKIVDSKIIERKNSRNRPGTSKDSEYFSKEKCLLDILLDLFEQNQITEEDVVSELRCFCTMAMDTLGPSIYNLIMLLAMHKNIQQKLYEEVNQTMDNLNQNLTTEVLDQMPYLEMVIKESMRYLTTVSYIGRITTEELDLTGCTLPQGTMCFISPYVMHRNPEIWEKPNEFYPEHFSEENLKKIHCCSYLSMSYGQRNCIAERLVVPMLKTTVAKLVKNFTFDTEAKITDLEFSVGVLLKWRCNQPIKLIPRDI